MPKIIKRRLITILTSMIIILPLTGCDSISNRQQEEELTMLIMLNYVTSLLSFDTNVDYQSLGIRNVQHFFVQYTSLLVEVERGGLERIPPHLFPEFADIILVHNAQEAESFPDDVIVVWPREDLVPSLIAGIHWAVNRTEHELIPEWGGAPIRPVLILEDFGLTYPLTAEDLVDNWRNVNELWFALARGERMHINGRIQDSFPLAEESAPSLIDGIHWAVNRPEHEIVGDLVPARYQRRVITFEEFGLTYPLTTADLIDNWDKVTELWFALTQFERIHINEHIRHGVPLVDEEQPVAN